MSTTITPAAARAVDAPTLSEALRRTAASNPDIVAVRTPDDSLSLTWSQLLARVDALAGGLAKLGVGHGDVHRRPVPARPHAPPAQPRLQTGRQVGRDRAGHVAGHHGVVGAAAGCAVGHHMNTTRQRDQQARMNSNSGSGMDNSGRTQ